MNEALLIASAVLDIGIVFLAYRMGKEWLYTTIVINLLLIALFGAKLIAIFGFATNIGNVFYASVFFATYLLLEHGKREDGERAIWIGVAAVAFFFVLMKGALYLTSIPETAEVSALMDQVLALAPRVAIASVAAYIVAQYANVTLYTAWYEPDGGVHWWLRAMSVMMAAQLIDSLIFFTVAFVGKVPTDVVLQSIIVGYVIKILIGAVSTPLIYESHRMRRAA